MNTRISINLAGFLALWLPAGLGYSDEPAPSSGADGNGVSRSTDDALIRSLLGDDSAPESPTVTGETKLQQEVPPPIKDDMPSKADAERTESAGKFPPEGLTRLLQSLDAAKQKLANGDTGNPTLEAQAIVVDELTRLIEAADQQSNSSSSRNDNEQNSEAAASPQAMPRDSGDAAQTGGTAAGNAAGSPQKNREGMAEESSDRVRDTETTLEEIQNRRSALVRDVWGHLPDRLREQLLNADSDRYLPQYDSLVRQYFESLSRPSSESDTR